MRGQKKTRAETRNKVLFFWPNLHVLQKKIIQFTFDSTATLKLKLRI